jgi:hypothetical protein
LDEPFYLGAYWGPRREPADECAQRLSATLVRLRERDGLLGEWFTKSARRDDGAVRVEPADVETLTRLLVAGVNRRDSDRTAIEELGFSAGLWNGDRDVPIGLTASCGVWSASRGIMNSFVLDLPPPSVERATHLYELDTAVALMRAVVEPWWPDWATLTSYGLADALDSSPREPAIGWITYLSDPRPVPDATPAAVRKQFSDGTLLVSTDSVANVDVAQVKALAVALGRAGSLAPTA